MGGFVSSAERPGPYRSLTLPVSPLSIRDDISLMWIVIPGLIKPALACPVLDTGYLIRGESSVFKILVPCFRRDFKSAMVRLTVLGQIPHPPPALPLEGGET
jgi:hypothetical protein